VNRATTLALIALLGCATTPLPPPVDPVGSWFCCDASGSCYPATGACLAGEELLWCKKVGKGPDGQKICLD
jgi:hypothetical protein